MADYYSHVSVEISLPDEAGRWALAMIGALDEVGSINDRDGRIKHGVDVWDAAAFVVSKAGYPNLDHVEWQDGRLWLGGRNVQPAAIGGVVHMVMRQFRLPGIVIFPFSFDCSKPRVDGYGGGVVLATRVDWRGIDWAALALAGIHDIAASGFTVDEPPVEGWDPGIFGVRPFQDVWPAHAGYNAWIGSPATIIVASQRQQ